LFSAVQARNAVQLFLVADLEVVARVASDFDTFFVQSTHNLQSTNLSAHCLHSLVESEALGAPIRVTAVLKSIQWQVEIVTIQTGISQTLQAMGDAEAR